jgi:DNA-binding NtrC family response regulator
MDHPPPKRILVVDDEETVRTVCRRMLTPLGYSVVTADNGDDAVKLMEQQAFDLLITDYRMPGGYNGLQVGQAMKDRYPHARIILMTAFPALDTAVETLRLGALDYLIKPFDQSELLERVKVCLSKQAPA